MREVAVGGFLRAKTPPRLTDTVNGLLGVVDRLSWPCTHQSQRVTGHVWPNARQEDAINGETPPKWN